MAGERESNLKKKKKPTAEKKRERNLTFSYKERTEHGEKEEKRKNHSKWFKGKEKRRKK